MPRACGSWVLDGGGFSELALYGQWSLGAAEYAAEIGRVCDGTGMPEWIAIQDWMCEPEMLRKTGLTVAEHQARTIRSYLDLTDIAPDLPWLPILQGWQPDDYLRHAEQYQTAGIDLARAPVVGLGSVCRRQQTGGIAPVVGRLAGAGIRLHAFGVKSRGLAAMAADLHSADSMAWSYAARKRGLRLRGCDHVGDCRNCRRWASMWAQQLLDTIEESSRTRQLRLDLEWRC
jgi:hypothetical protein